MKICYRCRKPIKGLIIYIVDGKREEPHCYDCYKALIKEKNDKDLEEKRKKREERKKQRQFQASVRSLRKQGFTLKEIAYAYDVDEEEIEQYG